MAAVVPVMFAIVQVILQIRAHAILGNKHPYMVIITALFVVETGFVMGLSLRSPKVAVVTFGNVIICSHHQSLSLVPSILFDAMLALIILYSAMLHVKSWRELGLSTTPSYGNRLLITLARDSIQYYICNIAVCVLAVMGSNNSGSLTILPLVMLPWVVVVPTASATGMILHLYQASPNECEAVIELDPPAELDTAIPLVSVRSDIDRERDIPLSNIAV